MAPRSLAAIVFVVTAVVSPSARAQDGRRHTIFLPTEVIGEAPVSRELDGALRAGLSISGLLGLMVPDATLRALIEERFSREEQIVGADEVGELVEAVHELETLVATRQREGALRQAQRVQELSQGTVDALASQRELAGTIFSGCLADAWLHIEIGEPDAARARLRACRVLHPDVTVNQRTTAPEVYGLLQQIDHELAARPTHELRIDRAVAGCEILVNGRSLASTPNPVEGLPIGDYQIELRCPGIEHSRVHSLVMPSVDRTIPIDPVFDGALRTADSVRLVFASQAEADQHRVEFALRLVALASATDAVLISPIDGGVRADRVTLAEGAHVIASVMFAEPGGARRVLEPLASARSIDARSFQDVPITPWSADGNRGSIAERATTATRSEVVPMVGVAVGVAGVLALGAGWGVFGRWSDLLMQRGGLDPMLSRYYVLGVEAGYYAPIAIGLGLGGAALASVSVPFWLPPERDVPWWSWAIGGAGLVALGVGIVFVALDGQPSGPPDFSTCHCQPRQNSLLLGGMLMATSAPLLAVPTTHLLRLAFGSHAPDASVAIGPDHAGAMMRGTW